MSLVGSLEDLGLGDILQIVSLSRKSGLLVLRSERGDGRIVLRDGLVRGAAIKGGIEDLRGLLVGGEFVAAHDFERAELRAREGDLPLESALAEMADLAPERLDSLRREHVERAVLRMFSWRAGEFSFEVREDIDPQDAELQLPTGINTQYLTMEATRLGDEEQRDAPYQALPGLPIHDDEFEAADVEPVFSGEESAQEAPAEQAEGPEAEAVDVVAFAAAQGAEAEPAEEAPIEEAPIPVETDAAPPAAVSVELAPEPPHDAAPAALPAHLVAIDPDLCALEWLKAALTPLFERVHIFQRPEIGIERIRQYLGRGAPPVMLVSSNAPADPLTGSADVGQLIARLRALAPAMPIAVLCEEGRLQPSHFEGADAVVFRPASPGADPETWAVYEDAAERLRTAVRDLAVPRSATKTAGHSLRDVANLSRLKSVSSRLRDPSSQGEVLALVLEFAAESFSRVAMFMVRDDVVAGMAQIGLSRAGGPDDEELRKIKLDEETLPALFRSVRERRSAVVAPLEDELDRRLAMLLGASAPREAYAAPIESAGCVVAVLYADNLPDVRPMGDTTAIEIVLHEAGLALDRAVLERALAEADR